MRPQNLSRMLQSRRIAIVGLSDDPSRPSFGIAELLRRRGREIVAVNPTHAHWQDLPCYPSLAAVPGRIELVNVFRRPEYCAQIAQEAVDAGARGLWLQSGIRNAEA